LYIARDIGNILLQRSGFIPSGPEVIHERGIVCSDVLHSFGEKGHVLERADNIIVSPITGLEGAVIAEDTESVRISMLAELWWFCCDRRRGSKLQQAQCGAQIGEKHRATK
jgi:hypothetical protein